VQKAEAAEEVAQAGVVAAVGEEQMFAAIFQVPRGYHH